MLHIVSYKTILIILNNTFFLYHMIEYWNHINLRTVKSPIHNSVILIFNATLISIEHIYYDYFLFISIQLHGMINKSEVFLL